MNIITLQNWGRGAGVAEMQVSFGLDSELRGMASAQKRFQFPHIFCTTAFVKEFGGCNKVIWLTLGLLSTGTSYPVLTHFSKEGNPILNPRLLIMKYQ